MPSPPEAVIEIHGQVVRGENPNNTGGDGGERSRGPGGGTPGGGGDGKSDLDEEGRPKLGFHGFTRGAAVVDIATGHVTR